MGAKLSKKKKGYCLGAGKDGESTDTTEVEQKETEAQAGQKDAAEPNGEKTPTDQTLNNGASEEQNARAETNSTEVPSGETTKDHLNKDQKSESKPSAEQKKVEELKKEQGKPEHTKSSNTSQQMATEGGKVKSQPDEKPLTDLDKDKESVAKNEPTQESKPVTEQKSSEPKQENRSVTKPSAPVPEQKEVAKQAPDPETKVKVEKMEKEQTPVLTTEHPSEQATKEPKPILASVKGPEKIPEIVETLVSETASVEPATRQKEPEPAVKVVAPETTEVSLQETIPAKELEKPEPDLAPVSESVESKVSSEPRVPFPEVKSVATLANTELTPCPEPKQLSETKQETESLPKPLPPNEVPDSTAQVEENVKSPETIGNVDLVIEIQAATTESAPSAEKNPVQDVAENCPSEELPESKAQYTISKEQKVENKEMQKVEERVLDKQPTEHGSLEKNCKDKEEVALDTQNEHDQVASEDTTVHHAAPDKNSEDKAENFKVMADKYGVGNGLPVKEEVKVHIENGCGKDLHELNGPGECREIEVCNE